MPYEKPGIRGSSQHDSEHDMSAKEGQFAAKDGKSRGTHPSGEQNPLRHVPLGDSPSIPNQPQPSVADEARPEPGRYEVFSGAHVKVGDRPIVGHPRVADNDPNVFHEEGPESNRWITPEAKGIRIIRKGEKQ
jgi:hypothetical protein